MGYRIKELREEKKMSQEDLAKEAGVSRTIISGLRLEALRRHQRRLSEK